MKRQRENERTEGLDLANCLMLLSSAQERKPHKSLAAEMFECKTCNRKFSSFQALGGHRASHKRPKLDAVEIMAQANSLTLGNNPKMHKCSICGLEFSLGQALGGHMRKHRDRAAINEFSLGQALGGHMRKHRDRAAINEESSSIEKIVEKISVLKRSGSTRIMCLDLNLTPLENDLKLLFGKKAPEVNLSLM